MRRLSVSLMTAATAIAAAALSASTSALGNETANYSYDALGRLDATERTGGPSTGVKMVTCFDRAGNRTRQDITTASPAACPTPAPALGPK